MGTPVKPRHAPIGGEGPVAFDRPSAARTEKAVRWVETTWRNRRPRTQRGRRVDVAPGAWALLAAGASISAASGTTLGSGVVTLCSRDGASLTSSGETVTAYNAGGGVTAGAGGRILKLGWVDGVWSLDVFPCS